MPDRDSQTQRRLLAALASRLPSNPAAALEVLGRHKVPAGAVDGLGVPGELAESEVWRGAVRADHTRADRMRRAASLVEGALAGVPGVAYACDGLGPLWSSDVDVFVTSHGLQAASERMAAAGLIPLDGLLLALRGAGRKGRPVATRQFAVVDGTEVLAAAELSTQLWDGGPPAAPAVERAAPCGGRPCLTDQDAAQRRMAKARSARRPTVRSAIELTALIGRTERSSYSAGALRRYSALEREIAGPGPLTAVAGRRRSVDLIWVRARLASLRRVVGARAPRRRVRLAFCGIDGSGKSTQVLELVENLARVGIPARPMWTRLGNGASRPVTALAAAAQRLLPAGTHSFQATRIAAGRVGSPETAAPKPPMSRRGVIGWSWALAVTLDYLARVHAGWRRAGHLLVLDRSLPDALVELHDDYGVALRLDFQRHLLERLVPPAHLTFHLRLTGPAAKARKDDDFTADALARQASHYEALLADDPRVVVLDAQTRPDRLALEVLRTVAAGQRWLDPQRPR